MQRNVPSPRPMPVDLAAWGAKHLASNDPYRHIGDHTYPAMHEIYADEFVGLHAPEGLEPIDLAFLVALGGQAKLAVDAVAVRSKADLAWKYALHLPFDHPGCSGDALWRFVKLTDRDDCPQRVAIGMVIEHVRLAFLPNRSAT